MFTNKINNIKSFLFVLIVFCLFIMGMPLLAQTAITDSTKLTVTADSLDNTLSQRGELNDYFYRVIWGTILVVALLVFGLYVYKRFMGNQAVLNKGNIKILSRLNIGPRQTILIISVEGKRLLLGVTDQNINVLKELEDNDTEALPEQLPEQNKLNFAAFLQKFKKPE